ncbi:MAG: CDP-alcohol phosphatidyltransferase family protein [Gammaproteobacteria bacterium]
MKARDIPNVLSVLRMTLAIPSALLLLREWYNEALLIFVVAGLSDGLDGYLAKRFAWRSRLGSILDPLADKILLLTNYIVLGWMGWIPVWLVAAVISRDVVVVGGALAYHARFGRYEMAPTMASKLNTTMQIVLVVVLVASLGLLSVPAWVVEGLIYTVLATTAWSGVDYVWTWGIQAYRRRSRRQHE